MASEFPDRPGNEGVVGRYANYFEIGQNAGEVIFDFGQAYSKSHERQVHTRIVTSPPYAKALLRLLEQAIERHEQVYGDIREE
ncbi:MAG: DUF3467 domain-containing protein [Nitrospira sp.]